MIEASATDDAGTTATAADELTVTITGAAPANRPGAAPSSPTTVSARRD